MVSIWSDILKSSDKFECQAYKSINEMANNSIDPAEREQQILDGFQQWASSNAEAIEGIDSSKDSSGSIQSFASWLFALSSGTFIGILLKFDAFVIQDQLSYKWLFLFSIIVFGFSAFASALFMVLLFLRKIAFHLAKDLVVSAPNKLMRRNKNQTIDEKIEWFQTNTRNSIKLAATGHNLLPNNFKVFKFAYIGYMLGLFLIGLYTVLFIIFKV